MTETEINMQDIAEQVARSFIIDLRDVDLMSVGEITDRDDLDEHGDAVFAAIAVVADRLDGAVSTPAEQVIR